MQWILITLGCYFLAHAHSSFLKSGNENKGSYHFTMWQAPQFQHEWSTLGNSEEEMAFSRWDQCYSHCWEVTNYPLSHIISFHLWYLPCLCSAIPGTGSLNIASQSCHVFLNITGQLCHAANHRITLVQGVMEKRMVTGHSHWDYRQQ